LTNEGLSNALVESTNTKLRLLTCMAYGFKSTDNLICDVAEFLGQLNPQRVLLPRAW
jgi:hypothetical protein